MKIGDRVECGGDYRYERGTITDKDINCLGQTLMVVRLDGSFVRDYRPCFYPSELTVIEHPINRRRQLLRMLDRWLDEQYDYVGPWGNLKDHNHFYCEMARAIVDGREQYDIRTMELATGKVGRRIRRWLGLAMDLSL